MYVLFKMLSMIENYCKKILKTFIEAKCFYYTLNLKKPFFKISATAIHTYYFLKLLPEVFQNRKDDFSQKYAFKQTVAL